MSRTKYSLGNFLEHAIPWLVLAVMLVYTYAKFFEHSYGFRWDTATATIIYVFDQQPEPTLREGDQIVRIGSLLWKDFQADLRKTFFDRVHPGDVVPIVIERDGKTINISWVYPGFRQSEFLEQLFSEWIIAYAFWLAGLVTILLIRPKDDRWLLMALFNFLTAIWLTAGSGVSAFHIWYSALVLRVVVWLCVPVYLHLHWVFPQSLGKLSPKFLWSVYGITLVVSLTQWFQLLPSGYYFLGFVIALLGSFILLIVHIWRQPQSRSDLRFLFVPALFAIALTIIWQIIYNLNEMPLWLGSAGIVGLPLLPLAYLYSAFRRGLGDLEMRVNRFFTIYFFIILLGIVEIPLIVTLEQQTHGEALITGLLAMVLTAIAFIWVYPVFESFIERRFFGITLPSQQLLERYSTHITTSASILDLTRVLHDEILSSLLIRQFAFIISDHGNFKLISILNVQEDQLPEEQDMPDLQTQSGTYLQPALGFKPPLDWISLVLPLKLGDQTLGFWLFGRRDPDDLYAQAEIPILRSLANQTAVALSNILQTRQIKEIYEANILRHEQDRLRLARDLHDSVLNELAAFITSDDTPILSPQLQTAYERVTERLREIVSDLRPPMLNFGLQLALQGLVDNLMERNHDVAQIVAHIQAESDCRYAEPVEINLYRIVQEACENSLRYAHANTIQIAGTLTPASIEIAVLDDGIGFVTETNLKLNEMSANKHFGLLNMLERASLINAEINIASKPQQGTQIKVQWKAN